MFSKFYCKSGFRQIKMDDDYIPWTAFSCSEGHLEWIFMLFGLKNALSIFQHKMDQIFRKYSKFILLYVDDTLVFSQNLEDYYNHLFTVFNEFFGNGPIISKKKIELRKKYIEFLGIKIRKGKIKLQEHIVKKILDFSNKIEDTKKLQAFL